MSFTWDHVLYRFYDREGALLYVGITSSIRARFKWHAAKQLWWPEVADCRIQFYPDRTTLTMAERVAIRYERPRHNIQDPLVGAVNSFAPWLPEQWSPPCIPRSTTEKWMGCTCRNEAEHFGWLVS